MAKPLPLEGHNVFRRIYIPNVTHRQHHICLSYFLFRSVNPHFPASVHQDVLVPFAIPCSIRQIVNILFLKVDLHIMYKYTLYIIYDLTFALVKTGHFLVSQ